MKPFSRVLSISSASVLKLLTDIQSGGGNFEIPDSQTSACIDIVCQHLERLKITELKTHADVVTERTIVTAVAEAHEFKLANFTSSDCANSIADLAQYLADILQLMYLGRNESFAFNDQLCSRDTRVAEATRCVKAIETTVGDGSPTVPIVKPYFSNRLDKANNNNILWTTNSTYSWPTVSNGVYPTTFPSALLEEIDVSGCTPPVSH